MKEKINQSLSIVVVVLLLRRGALFF